MHLKKRIKLSELAEVDITTVNKEDLADLSGFTFDNTIIQEQRAKGVITAAKNPYCFRLGETGVKLEFPEDAPTLQDLFSDFLKRNKNGL
ncbi:DUF6870 family protein [Paenibacillus sp. FSL K6-1096]|uniref:DUF6870 family protein n=1 Tax=Paenibacillus sp. FSL K6-1096 TaxID=2921460 RepID=UPI0030EE2468